MIPILFDEKETEFQSNGIGPLHETLISETSEGLNGELELYLEYPVNGDWFDEIKEFRYILAKPNDRDDEHAFRIYDIVKTDEPETIQVSATSKSNELGDNLIDKLTFTDARPVDMFNSIKVGSKLPVHYEFISDVTSRRSAEWEFRSPLNAIMGEKDSIIDLFGGEIKRTNDYIYHYAKRGRDRVTTIRQDKNLDGFKQTISTKGLVTKILPHYTYQPDTPDGYTGAPIEPAIMRGSVVTSSKSKTYPTDVIRPIDFSSYREDIEVYDTIKTTEKLKNGKDKITETQKFNYDKTLINLNKKAETYFTEMNPGVDIPKVGLEVDLIQLSDTPKYEEFEKLEGISISDTVDVWVERYGIDVTVKVQHLKYDTLSEKVISLVAGSNATSTYNSTKAEYAEAFGKIEDYMSNGFDHVVQMATNGTNKIWNGATKPTVGMREGDTWFEPTEGGNTVIWNYLDGIWTPIVDTEDTEINKLMIEDAKLEIIKAQEAADKANKEINDAIDSSGFNTLKGLTDNLGTVSSRADALSKTAKTSAEKAISDASTAQTRANKAITDASTAQGTANTALTDAGTALTEIGTLDGRVTTVVSDIDGELSRKTNKTDHDALKGTVTTQGTVISQNATDIKTKATTTTVNTLTGRVSTAESGITQNANAIKLKASQTDVDDISGRVVTAESSLSVLPGQIASKASQTTVNTLSGRVTTAETGITQNANDIKLRATNTTVNALTGRVSTAESTLSVLPGQISSKVSQVEVDASIDGIQLNNRNFLSGRHVKIGNTTSSYLERASGTHTLSGKAEWFIIYPNHEMLQLRERVTLSFEIRKVSGDVLDIGGHSSPHLVTDLVMDGKVLKNDWQSTNPYPNDTEWRTFEMVITLGTLSSPFYIQPNRKIGYTYNCIVEIKNIKLEKGVKAKGYSMSPEDTTQAISAVQSDVTQKHDSITSTVSSLDGRVVQNKQTIDGITRTVSGHGGRLSTVEQTASGLQTTVADKANQSQVTQLSTAINLRVTTATHNSAISQLSNNINLKVSKGDVMSQINVEAGRTLIQSGKVLINASSTTITGTAFIDGAVMKNASMDGAVIKNATIASAKIANLDVSKIVGNTTSFVTSAWNKINDSVSIDGSGITMIGNNIYRKNVNNAEGINIYGDYGAYRKAGAIGYFRTDPNTTDLKANVVEVEAGHHHYIGMTANEGYSLVLGYRRSGWGDRFYRRSVVVSGDSGVVTMFGSLSMRNLDGISWLAGGSNIHEVSQRLEVRSKGQLLLYNSISSLKVRIGANFDVYSDLNMNSNNIYNNSDVRLKKNITPTDLKSLDVIKQWNFVDYEWRDESLKGTFMGVIAQNTPEIASYNEETGFYAINSSKQLMMTTHAVKQLYESGQIIETEIDSLRIRIEQLEEK